MEPLAAILSGDEAVVVIAVPTAKSAVIVNAHGRCRAVHLSSLTVLPGWGVRSVMSARADAASELRRLRADRRRTRHVA